METYSDFLFARPSFLEGVARIFDLGDTMNEYNVSDTGHEADADAIRMDWAAIGQDIGDSMQMFEEKERDALSSAEPD